MRTLKMFGHLLKSWGFLFVCFLFYVQVFFSPTSYMGLAPGGDNNNDHVLFRYTICKHSQCRLSELWKERPVVVTEQSIL